MKDQGGVYLDYDQCVLIHDDIANLILEKTTDETRRVQSLTDQIKKTPAYSFVKKNALKKAA